MGVVEGGTHKWSFGLRFMSGVEFSGSDEVESFSLIHGWYRDLLFSLHCSLFLIHTTREHMLIGMEFLDFSAAWSSWKSVFALRCYSAQWLDLVWVVF